MLSFQYRNDIFCTCSWWMTIKTRSSGYRLGFLRALYALGPSSSRGYFINSCYAHCQTEVQETWYRADSPKLANKVIHSLNYLTCSFNFLLALIICSVLSCRTTDCAKNVSSADNSQSTRRLVLWQKSIPEDWLPISLWQNLSQPCFWSKCPSFRHWYITSLIEVILWDHWYGKSETPKGGNRNYRRKEACIDLLNISQ